MEPADSRKGIDGLARVCREVLAGKAGSLLGSVAGRALEPRSCQTNGRGLNPARALQNDRTAGSDDRS